MHSVPAAITRLAPLWIALAFPPALGACGGASSSADESDAMQPEETVVGDMIEQKREIPEAAEAATRQHVDETRRALEAAEGAKSDEPAQ